MSKSIYRCVGYRFLINCNIVGENVQLIECIFCLSRFHSPAKEPALNYDVILPVDDAVQLSVVQYRNKLYEVRKGATAQFRSVI